MAAKTFDELVDKLKQARGDLNVLITRLELYPETVDFNMDYIYNVQSRLSEADKLWDRVQWQSKL